MEYNLMDTGQAIKMMENKFPLNCKEIENLTEGQRVKYYTQMRNLCTTNGKKYLEGQYKNPSLMDFLPYDFEVTGTENLPNENKILFVANHSNSHDFFTVREVFRTLKMKGIFLASNEGLNLATLSVFKLCGGILLDRGNRESISKAIIKFTSNIINGRIGVIFGESTWNLHPIMPMHLIKAGAAMIGAITQVPIIPTAFEYIEVPKWCVKEQDIYCKCVVKFCPPINIIREESLISQTDKIQLTLEQNCINLWKQFGIRKGSIKDIDQEVYLNHTYLKKFKGAGGFKYDSEHEMSCLLVKDKLSGENEYHIDKKGNFTAGILTREEGKRYIGRQV